MMKSLTITMFLITALMFFSCRKVENDTTPTNVNYPDWTTLTHSDQVAPDYNVVFPQDKVLRFDIIIDPDDWAAMQKELEDNLGSSSGGGPGGGGPGGGGPGGGGPGGLTDLDFTPSWHPCSFVFDGIEWYHVGVRFKGNSSLRSTYQSGNGKLSMKLDFDQFEDVYPELKNQRFYGFKQLNLNNNFDDASLMREKIGADVFRSFGLASPHTAFCAVYVDYGDGPIYFGLYTLVEEVDDSVLDTQFADGSGNLYKPEGNAATFAEGTYSEAEMYKKTNENEGDYSDVKALYDAINSDLRTSDPEQWKTNLEKVFNVDVFLKWLAANTTIQNWDTYGRMPHNYYLYNNPEDHKLTWIPWDNNEAFQEGKNGGALSLSLDEVSTDWPLIRYIMDEEEYISKYRSYLQQFITDVFTVDNMSAQYDRFYDLIREYAYSEQAGYTFLLSSADFDNAVAELKNHVAVRNQAVVDYLK